ncbi:AmmeMemoRadiSam system protein A [Blattamonas nauphoetae]|uniref:AmmeMemoRadiSam system protein A n=1 Tax=Blattamonas nauphoetae TaxID=2049346 RepID=A0ABQ9XWH0_9EUKA|nr:AmmeMemoRadiSam system protein A [Blattamonas nauphoetae]
MTEPATQSMCGYCFDTLMHNFSPSVSITPPDFPIEEYPLFVTWHKNGHLRGCIGTFSSMRIDEGLREYSLISALQDSRFRPVVANEIPELSVDISLLHSFEKASKWNDWQIGKHGIRVKYTHEGQTFGATYLPNVMPEQGWNQEQAVTSCLRKGRFYGKFDDTVKNNVEVTRYQSSIAKMSYQEYLEWKKGKS